MTDKSRGQNAQKSCRIPCTGLETLADHETGQQSRTGSEEGGSPKPKI